MLSADAFHQEYIPIEPVVDFAKALLKNQAPKLRVHPAWIDNKEFDNPYNTETKRIIKLFNDLGIESSKGNNIFPTGNALKYLSEYFTLPEKIDLTVPCGQMPYTNRLDQVDCVSVNPNGDIKLCSYTIGNICDEDVLSIIDRYDPYNDPMLRSLLEDGVTGLLRYTESKGMDVDISGCFTVCGVCRKIMTNIQKQN